MYERITGMKISKNGNCQCPFHNSESNDNAAIDEEKNWFSCFSHLCAKGMKPYEFIAKYYNLCDFKEIAKKVNEFYPGSFTIYSSNDDKYLTLSTFYNKMKKDMEENINRRIEVLNNFLLEKQGIHFEPEPTKEFWDFCKDNELYRQFKDYIEINYKIGSFQINKNDKLQ